MVSKSRFQSRLETLDSTNPCQLDLALLPSMAIISDALRQAFMPKREYESLREEDKAWGKLQRPVTVASVAVMVLAIVMSTVISLKIVFPSSDGRRAFCVDRRLQSVQLGMNGGPDSDLFPGNFYLTDQEIADYYWMVVFIPSMIVFALSVVYLVAGMAVAYSAPNRHGCLKVVENNYCASRRGGVRCLSILNLIFAVVFGGLALFLGSSLLTMMSNCSKPLFWCYEIACWGLVVLYGGTAFFLRRKAATILDEGNFSGRNLGLEMLEASPLEVTPEVERRVNEGFKAWMGPSLLSSDEEDEPDSYDRHLIQHVLTQTGKDSELDKFSVKSFTSSFPAFHALNNAVWFGNQFWIKMLTCII